MDRVALALEVAKEQLGRPYLWGGDDPMAGFDCSGLVVEVLKSVALFPPDRDTTADGLMNWGYPSVDLEELLPGCIVFWGSGERATHVEMVYAVCNELVFTIGASGGGSQTTGMAEAIAQNAYIKIRRMRGGAIAARDPFARAHGITNDY